MATAFADLAYFLGCALTVDDRRRWGDELVARSTGPWASARRTLERALRAGVPPPGVLRRDDGDRVADDGRAHRARRRHVHDRRSPATRSRCSTSTRSRAAGRRPTAEPLRPAAEDEARTRPGPSSSGTRAGTSTSPTRGRASAPTCGSGLYPNLGRSWYTALDLRPRPPDGRGRRLATPRCPGRDLALRDRGVRGGAVGEAPLRALPRSPLTGTGEAHDDPAASCAASPAARSTVALDLVWETDGTPYPTA